MTMGLALTSDGRRIATIGSGLLAVRETESGDVVHEIETPGRCVDWSPDGRWIATARTLNNRGDFLPGFVTLWNAETGDQLREFEGGGYRLAVNHDGSRIASASPDGDVPVWDSETGELLFTLRGHTGKVTGVAFSPDGLRLVTGGGDETIKVWDARQGEELLTLRGHQGAVASVAFSPDGRYIASCSSSPEQVRLWDAGPPGSAVLQAPGPEPESADQ